MTFDTLDQSYEGTWPDKQKDHDKDKYKDKDNDKYIEIIHSKSDPRDLWHLSHMIRVIMRQDLTKKKDHDKDKYKDEDNDKDKYI